MKKNLNLDYREFTSERRLNKIRSVLEKRQTGFTIVMENINDPHNLAAAIRSCDAVGIYNICLIYHGTQPFPQLSEKSSASARKWVNMIRYDSVEECYTELRKEGKKIYTTHMSKDAVSLYDLNLSEPAALVFGNEHEGVSEEAWKQADGNFLIPQVGMIQSLNISVACAVSVYEVFRQRKNAGLYDTPQFPPDKLDGLIREWAAK